MSVHKDKNRNNWYVKYKNQTTRGFKTKTEAQRYEAKLKLSMITNENCSKVFFHDIVKDYEKYLYQRYKNSNITYGTYSKNKNVINRIIFKYTDNKKVNKISEFDCRKFAGIVSDLNYTTVYKNFILNVYKAIFKHGIRYFGLIHNPSMIIAPLKKSFKEKMKQRETESNIWSIEEFNAFIKCVDKEVYRQLFVILYYTGLRLGEALALQWKDFSDGYLHINKSLTKKTEKGYYEIKETKNISSIRDVELGHSLCMYLDKFKQEEMKSYGFSEDWFIFGRKMPLPETNIQRIKNNAIKEANVKKIRLHDFRHSHASNLIANGINIVAVSRRLGHSDVNMTLSVYTHLLKKNEVELVNYIDDSSQNLLHL